MIAKQGASNRHIFMPLSLKSVLLWFQIQEKGRDDNCHIFQAVRPNRLGISYARLSHRFGVCVRKGIVAKVMHACIEGGKIPNMKPYIQSRCVASSQNKNDHRYELLLKDW